ncbi:MAG: transposase, partial [Thermodesulfobacteriota bacterium]|nr:transposase [Thermodesulfobacteriota bacterium]
MRTTNIIERLNKEFKRRTKPMEIVAGEKACYTLLAFIVNAINIAVMNTLWYICLKGGGICQKQLKSKMQKQLKPKY